MWCRVLLILSLAFTLAKAYDFYNQEEFDRYSEKVAQRFFDVHSQFVETGEVSEELRQFYREFQFPDGMRYREISDYPKDFSVSTEYQLSKS